LSYREVRVMCSNIRPLVIITQAQISLSDVWTGRAGTDIPKQLRDSGRTPIKVFGKKK
jgi:hypothetical protein